LDDVSNVFWVDDEIKGILTETLRTWGVLSAFWRERGTFNTKKDTTFYDIPANITSGLLDYTVTDYDLIKAMQYHFLEKATSQSTWQGTEMFDLSDLTDSIQRRMNQFLQDTGIIISYSSGLTVPPPPASRLLLPDNTIDVRRLVYIDPSKRFYRLYKEDELAMSYYILAWPQTPGTPNTYSVLAARPLEIQLQPPPILTGTLEMLSVNTSSYVFSSAGSTVLSLFDDLTPFIKWGAMADCLGIDGPARDPIRADFCEARYQQGVEFTKLLGLVIHARINDQPVRPTTVTDLDDYAVSWQNNTGTPIDLGMAGWNMLAASPVPDGVYGITLDIIRKAVIPILDVDFVQVGREQINSILDYAENIALFKVGGKEFQSTVRQANDFMIEAATYNRRLAASARYIMTAKRTSQDDKEVSPRELQTTALGAGPGDIRNARTGNQ